MKNKFLNIASNETSGFCNQIYCILYTCSQSYKNESPNFIFLGKYLKEICSENYCNISDIIDIDATNKHLEKFNVYLIDFYNFEFNIVSARYGINETCVDLTETVRPFLNDNIFNIGSDVNLNTISVNPVDFYKKNYFIDLNPSNIKLYITYSINNIIFHEVYEQSNGFLLSPVLIDLVNVNFEKSMVRNDQSEFCTSFLKHLTFQPKFVLSAQNFIVNNVKTQNINCIHLRLEYDALKHWSKENNMSMREFKRIMEDRYISEIKLAIDKRDTTIVLASNYDNRVIKYLLDNNYNIIMTPKIDEYRDIAAIYDLHIGQYCNNVYIFLYDSSFSFTLLYRIYELFKIKPIMLHMHFEVEKNYKMMHGEQSIKVIN